jgi:transcriptional regulator with XRE-family HTH domain
MQRLGEKLRALRRKNGLSYRQLAAELGVTHVNLISIESGRSFPSLALLGKIADFFDVSYDELLDDDVELGL